MDNKEYCIIIKVSIIKEDVTALNIYAPNNRASKYLKQKLICNEKKLEWQEK